MRNRGRDSTNCPKNLYLLPLSFPYLSSASFGPWNPLQHHCEVGASQMASNGGILINTIKQLLLKLNLNRHYSQCREIWWNSRIQCFVLISKQENGGSP